MFDSRLRPRLKRKIKEIPAMCGSVVVTIPPIEARLKAGYDRARAAWRSKLPPLSDLERKIVSGVEKDGLYITSLDELGLPGSQEMLAAGQKLALKYEAMKKAGALDGIDSFQADSIDVMSNRDIFYWGLNDRLLGIVENYLGLPTAFDGLNLFYTKADGREVAARKWHLDGEDRRIMKVAVYFNDVDLNGGPLQILKQELKQEGFLARLRAPVYTSEALEPHLDRPLEEADIATCTGPAGTVIFCDTARKYHRGRPAVSRDRCAVFFNYFSQLPLRPFYCERSTLSRTQIEELAEGLAPQKRAALLWYKTQPPLARILPAAPIA
jgi:hypothetical protein